LGRESSCPPDLAHALLSTGCDGTVIAVHRERRVCCSPSDGQLILSLMTGGVWSAGSAAG
jgi:hypothetical protein